MYVNVCMYVIPCQDANQTLFDGGAPMKPAVVVNFSRTTKNARHRQVDKTKS